MSLPNAGVVAVGIGQSEKDPKVTEAVDVQRKRVHTMAASALHVAKSVGAAPPAPESDDQGGQP